MVITEPQKEMTINKNEITTQEQSTPQHLLQLAINKGVDVEQLSKLMDLQERWEKKESKKAFITAMSLFQSKVPVLQKSKKVEFQTRNGGRMNYQYADLGEIAATIRDTLYECGITYRWEIDDIGAQIKCTCHVSHVNGHTETTAMIADKDDSGNKNSIQQKGSTITYLQRYTLIGALGLSTANSDIDAHTEHKEPQSVNNQAEKQKVIIRKEPAQFDELKRDELKSLLYSADLTPERKSTALMKIAECNNMHDYLNLKMHLLKFQPVGDHQRAQPAEEIPA